MLTRISLAAGLLAAALWNSTSMAADTATAVDLKKLVPTDVHMAVYGRHNEERDYQAEYLEQAWNTVQEERIGERVLEIITSHAPKDKLAKVEAKWEELREALEPIDCEALLDAEEVVFAQRMDGPFNQSLVVLRMDPEGAEKFEEGVTKAFDVLADWGGDKVSVETTEEGDVTVTHLSLPGEAPFQASIATHDDLVFLSTAPELLSQSLKMMDDPSGPSKFDDERLKEALAELPKAEDAITFFDGRQLWKSLGGIGDFIREKAGEKKDAQRIAKLMDRIIGEVGVIDYEVGVEYTEDGQNRSASLGKLAEDFDEKLLGKALGQGEPFEDWQKWVPADATSFSLNTGINLHVLYEGIIEIVRDEFPESHEHLDRFEEHQEKLGVHLDRDILQSFSGECVTFALPAEGSKAQQSVTALKCENPEKIEELIERAFNGLQNFPAVKAQGIELADVEDMEGFHEIKANIFQMAGARPVYGFNDGWMILASSQEAAQKLLDVRSGDAKSIDRAESFEEFDLEEGDGDTYAVSYSDIGAGIHQAADFIDKVGTMAPMIVGMAAAQAKPEDVKPVVEALGLLPSIAKVLRKFDYFDHRMSITREGPLEDSYLKEQVTLIKQPSDRVAKSKD